MVTSVGEFSETLFVVHSGWFTLRATHPSGTELVLGFLGTGDCIGLPEMLLAVPSETEVVAQDHAVAWSIPWRDVAGLAMAAHELHVAMERELARDMMRLRSRLVSLAFSSIEGRLAAVLLDIERVAQRAPGFRFTQGMIAAAIGASRPKLNRCLKALEHRGVLLLQNGALPEILDRDALYRLL